MYGWLHNSTVLMYNILNSNLKEALVLHLPEASQTHEQAIHFRYQN